MAFAQDVKHYRKAGILGIGTESRGATATTFLNLYFRGQLMWNPDADVEAQLAEFYPKFYGPAAKPMRAYWSAIYKAWEQTLSTEHEYFVAPAIYTPELVTALKASLAQAKTAIEPLRAKANPDAAERLYLERMRFTELSFEVLDSYMAMQRAVSDVDFKTAVAQGERGLAAREELTKMNPAFTTYKNIGEHGAAWWPGEVQQYRDLLALTDGSRGTLLAKTPVEWAFRRDPHDTGLPRGWAYTEPDLATWNARGGRSHARAAEGLSGRVGDAADRHLPAGPGRPTFRRTELHRALLVSDRHGPRCRASDRESRASCSPACSTNAGSM